MEGSSSPTTQPRWVREEEEEQEEEGVPGFFLCC